MSRVVICELFVRISIIFRSQQVLNSRWSGSLIHGRWVDFRNMPLVKRLIRWRRARVAQRAEHRRAANDEVSADEHERGQGDDLLDDEEKVLAGRPDANIPAMLTKDVRGG